MNNQKQDDRIGRVKMAFLVGLLFSISCSSKPPPVWQPFPNGLDENLQAATGISEVRPAPDGPPPLSITAQPVQETKAAVHPDLQGTVFTIHNNSKKAIVVLRVEPVTNAGQEPFQLSYRPPSGPDLPRYELGEGIRHPAEYVIRVDAQSYGGMPVHECLLLPGWSFVFTRDQYTNSNPYIPVAAKEVFAVTYIATEKDYEEGSGTLDDWYVYTCEDPLNINKGSTFLPFNHDRWIARKGYVENWPLSEEDSERLKVFVEMMPDHAWVSRVEVSFAWQEGKGLDTIGKQLAASIEPTATELSYCFLEVLDAYLVRQPDKTLLYDPSNLTKPAEVLLPFPPSMLTDRCRSDAKGCILHIEGGDFVHPTERSVLPRPTRSPELWILWGRYSVRGQSSFMAIDDECIGIPHEEIHEFLRIATAEGARIVLREHEYKPRRYELQGIDRP